jgi:hypothetical protein
MATSQIDGDLRVIGNLLDTAGAVGVSGQLLSSTDTGTNWVDAPAGVSGSNSVYVAPVGTPEENGVLLLNGLAEAVSKIVNIVVPGIIITDINQYQQTNINEYRCYPLGGVLQYPVVVGLPYEATFEPDGTPIQVLIEIIQVTSMYFRFTLSDILGNPIDNIDGNPPFPLPPSISISPSTLIVAPGDYSIASDFILNNLVNVTSLTGQADVNISTSNVRIQSGANNSSHPISIVGLNLTTSLWIQSNLSSLTFKNCKALGTNSFSIETGGTGSITGTFEDCTGDFRSFGSGTGVTAAGIFIRCKATATQAFGGGGSTSGYFEHCGGAAYSNNFLNINSSLFGTDGTTINGSFYYCTAYNASFASNNTGATGAEFYFCVANSQSFGYRNNANGGKYYNCVGNAQVFGSNQLTTTGDTNARYYNCVMQQGPLSSNSAARYFNCTANSSWPSTFVVYSNGLMYNCSFGAGGFATPSVTGTGKIRNCLGSSFEIVNLG